MLEKQLLRLLLNYSFWKVHKGKFIPELFPANMQNLYKLIIDTHEKTAKDLTIPEIQALYRVSYPLTTKAQWDLLENILENVPGELSEDVAKEVLQKAFILEQGRQIANIGFDICNGKTPDIEKIRETLQKISQGEFSTGDEAFLQVSSELEDILEIIDVTTKWEFNLAPLRSVCPGVGPGIFCIAAGRVETGKTAFGISLCAAPHGFAEQGAIVHYYCNEEHPQRSQIRAVTAYTGMVLQEVILTPEPAKAKYGKIRDNLKFFDCRGKSIYDLQKHVDQELPDVVVLDQLDKLSISGNFAREDERLSALYVAARNLGPAVIALTQLNAEAEGSLYVNAANLSQSRTGKAAEADILIGIGRSSKHDEYARLLNIIKNKLTGLHMDVYCTLQPQLSRYVANVR